MRIEHVDVAVIGGGPAGLGAAIAARKNGAERVMLYERGERLGGILNQCIHDGFGTHIFSKALTGPEYAQIYIDRLNEIGIPYELNAMVLDVTGDRQLTVCSVNGMRHVQAKSIVLTMGCRERTRGALRIPGTRPAGVYTAGVVQNYVNLQNIMVGRQVVVLGSGDIGLIMARRLTLEGVEVPCVAEILPYPSGLVRNIVQCLEDYNIPLYLNTTVVEIHGKDRLNGVSLARIGPKGGVVKGSKTFVPCDTLMLSVGLIPENELAKKAGVRLSPVTGGPVADDHFQTSVPGIFSAGNCLQVHDLVDYVTLESEKAGANAAAYADHGKLPAPLINVVAGSGIRYVLPQQISGEEAVDFSMRVSQPVRDAFVVFKRGDVEIRKVKQPVLEPSSMLRIRIRPDAFAKGAGDLMVEVIQ